MNFDKYINFFYAIVPPVEEWSMRTMHGSLAVYKNKIITMGLNVKKTNPINLRNKKINRQGMDVSSTKFTCSEWICLNRLRKTTNIPFNNITLINLRMNRNHTLCYSAPCVGCRNLLTFIQPRKVFYTNDQGGFEEYDG